MFISGLQKVGTEQSISNINFLMFFTVTSKLLFFSFYNSKRYSSSHQKKKKNASHHTVVGDREVQLSKVQKQQKTIAHTIIRSPEILLIDKATSTLDTNYERMF